MTARLPQDPNELFDVIDASGNPTGIVKRRADIHRDGDWHRAIHVWLYGQDATGTFLLLQRRGFDKDSWPGRLDATAAGHLAAGEVPEDALREVDEELGFAPDPALLRTIGTRVIADETPGRLDREHQTVYLLRNDRPLTGYRPDPVEVDALVRVPLSNWLAFLAGDVSSVSATAMSADDRAIAPMTITAAQLIPVPDRYYQRVAGACQRALAGEQHIVI